MTNFEIVVNGVRHAAFADPEEPLLWLLRDRLGLTGTKYGCGRGLCGTCSVLVDGTLVRSCITPAASIGKAEVTTIEGLASESDHPVLGAWVAERVSQCGYCQPGQILSAVALLFRNAHPTDAEIDAALRGNLCRCGTYPRIRRAIRRAVTELKRG